MEIARQICIPAVFPAKTLSETLANNSDPLPIKNATLEFTSRFHESHIRFTTIHAEINLDLVDIARKCL